MEKLLSVRYRQTSRKKLVTPVVLMIALLMCNMRCRYCADFPIREGDKSLRESNGRTAKASSSRREVKFLHINSTDDMGEVWARFAWQTDKSLVSDIRSKRTKRRGGGDHVIDLLPTNRRMARLKSRTGFFLEILPGQKVGGNVNKTKYSRLELQAITPNIKRIKGVETDMYLAVNRKGKVVLRNETRDDTYFYEEYLENYEYAYSSVKYSDPQAEPRWYLGLKRKGGGSRDALVGKTKRASRTLPGDVATHFQIIFDDFR